MWSKTSTGVKFFVVTILCFIFNVHQYHPLLYYAQDGYTVNKLKQQIALDHGVKQNNLRYKNITTELLIPAES